MVTSLPLSSGIRAARRAEVRLQRRTRLPSRIAGSRWFTGVKVVHNDLRPLEAEPRDRQRVKIRAWPTIFLAAGRARHSRLTGAMDTKPKTPSGQALRVLRRPRRRPSPAVRSAGARLRLRQTVDSSCRPDPRRSRAGMSRNA